MDFELDITKDHTVCLRNAAVLMVLEYQFTYLHAYFRTASRFFMEGPSQVW